MDPEPTIFYNHVKLPVQGLEHQLRHKTFDLQFLLPERWLRGDDGVETVGVVNQWQVQLETHAMAGSPSLVLPRRTETRD